MSIEDQTWRHHILNRRWWGNVRTYRMKAFICPVRLMGRFVLRPLKHYWPVRQLRLRVRAMTLFAPWGDYYAFARYLGTCICPPTGSRVGGLGRWQLSWGIAKPVGPLVGRCVYLLRAPHRCECLVKRRRSPFFFFAGGFTALRAMDMFPRYSLLLPEQSGNPRGAWDVLRSGWFGIFGPPSSIQMDGKGEWKNEI